MPKLFNFSGPLPAQSSGMAFGVNTSTTCRITSSFTIASNVKAYAMLPGRVLLQQQSGGGTNDDRVNLILKPDVTNDIKLPIKYIIYRGLSITDFLSTSLPNNSTIVTDPGTTVDTTGLEILVKMKEAQDARAPGDAIPVEALFGDELTPPTTKTLDEFFFKKVVASFSLFHIDGGIEIGNFLPGDAGIDIVLENPEFKPNVEMAKAPFFQLDVSGITNPADLKTKKDLARHFVDPAAFFGVHIDIAGGMEFRNASGTPQPAPTPLDILANILNPFYTKNSVYLDIRSENGYSYNFYDNYVGSGTDADKELQLGATAGSLTPKEYYPNGWPVFVVDVIAPSSTLPENEFFLKLRVNDNQRPLVASLFSKISPVSVEDNGVRFVDESELLTSLILPLQEFTEPISISVPNVIDGGSGVQPASIVKLNYFKQALPISPSVKFPYVNFSDYLFGPHDVSIPFDLTNNVQWISSHHLTYVDALNDGHVIGQMNTPIQSINVGTQEIEIVGEIPVDRTKKVNIENGTLPQNVGEYTIAAVTSALGITTIKTLEPIPGALQIGDTLEFSVYVDGEMDYSNNKLIIKNIDYSGLAAFVPSSQLDFYSKYNFSNSYEVASAQFVSPNTEVLFTTTPKKIGYAGIMETGIIFEADTNSGGPFDDDRIMYYASPLAYFSKDGVHHGFSFANQGGASDLDSILDVLKKMMPAVVIDEVNLKPTLATDIITFSYSSLSMAKEMLYLMGITKTEFQGMSIGSLVNHNIMYRLEVDGTKKTDTNSVDYYQYQLILCGLDSSSNYTEVNTGIYLYTTDHLIFVTQAFAAKYGIDASIAAQALDDFLDDILNNAGSDLEELIHKSNEEIANLKTGSNPAYFWNQYGSGLSNKALFELDPSMATKVTDLKLALDASPETIPDLENVIKQKGADLFQHAKTQIKLSAQPWTNKDGILYVTRQIMLLVIKNHPTVLAKFPAKVADFSKMFEKHSRGLEGTEKPDFTSSTADFNFLVTGYDPFGVAFPNAYYDWDGHQSNSSGNLALALDGEILTINHDGGPRTALIRTVVFPVRFKEFDDGWIEDFFQGYIDDPNVHMIPTFSYGIESNTYDFEIERVAARYRGIGSPDNNRATSTASTYLEHTDNDEYEFLSNKLPIHSMSINGEIGLDQALSFEFYNGDVHTSANKVSNGSKSNPSSNLYDPTLIHEPNFGNYKSSLGSSIAADRIKSKSGPGGTYLSNEIFYRVALLREKSANPNKQTGHIHLGYLTLNPQSTDRNNMLTNIRQSLTNAIPALYDTPKTMEQFMKIVDTTYTNNDFFTSIVDNTWEEQNQLSTIWQTNGSNPGNKAVFELDPTMKHKVVWFKKTLDFASTSLTYSNAETIVQDAASDLFKYAKKRIKELGKAWSNKDGILYITRLMMQVILKNHPRITTPFSAGQISDLYDEFERYSRGLDGPEKPEFTRYSAAHKKILITGFDPYGAGFDWQDHNSNPSGNLAMALDGTSVSDGGVTGNIRSAVFPVRYKEFNAGWVETFVTPYINDVDMIITFSYGIDTHDFQIDRFASNFRYGDLTDNDNATSYNDNHDNQGLPGDTFIQNQLPWDEFKSGNLLTIPMNPSVVGINHRAYWEVFADKYTPPTATNVNVTALHTLSEQFVNFGGNYWDLKKVIPIQKIAPFDNTNPYGNSQVSSDVKYVTPADPDEIKFPSWTNYSDAALTSNYNNFSIKARIGSGQFYHSNEIAYRVSNVRNINNPSLKSGHIHIGFLTGDPVTDRDDMIKAANYMIKKMLNAL